MIAYIFKRGKDGFLYPCQEIEMCWTSQTTYENIEAVKESVMVWFLERKNMERKYFLENYKILFNF